MRQACSRSQGWLAGCRLSEAGCPCQPGLPGAVPAHADHRSSPAQPFHLAGRPAVSAFRLVMCLPWHPYISLCVAPDEMAPRESLLASWNPTAEAQELRCCALQACLKGIRAWAHCSCMGVCRQKVMQEGADALPARVVIVTGKSRSKEEEAGTAAKEAVMAVLSACRSPFQVQHHALLLLHQASMRVSACRRGCTCLSQRNT